MRRGADAVAAATLIMRQCLPTTQRLSCSTHQTGAGSSPITLSQQEAVAAAFRASVATKRVGNFQLRTQIKDLPALDAEAALRGAREAGLRISPESHEIVLRKLMEGGHIERMLQQYQQMLKEKTVPNTETYNLLLKMCCDRGVPESSLRLFDDMRKRGRQPNITSYELAMVAHSMLNPPQWEKAIEIFDRLCATRPEQITERTYQALMRVYCNMRPFEWRVVYNCFYEMRSRRPKIPFSWATHAVVAEAMREGGASYMRRGLVYVDTWIQVTPMFSLSFFKGLMIVFVVTTVIKIVFTKYLLYLLGVNTKDDTTVEGSLSNMSTMDAMVGRPRGPGVAPPAAA